MGSARECRPITERLAFRAVLELPFFHEARELRLHGVTRNAPMLGKGFQTSPSATLFLKDISLLSVCQNTDNEEQKPLLR